MNQFKKTVFILALSLFSTISNASVVTWDFEFEVSFVEDRTNGDWSNPLVAGDILSASLSFDDNIAIISDSSSQTVFDASNVVYDISSLTSDAWLENLAPSSWVNHSNTRVGMSIQSAYSVDNALVGDINWEALIFGFLDYDAVAPYNTFPADWGKTAVSFTYHRDLDASSSGSEIYITGDSISATQRVAVSEPTTIILFLMALLFIGSRKMVWGNR